MCGGIDKIEEIGNDRDEQIILGKFEEDGSKWGSGELHFL